jgi:hypothetical protein
MEEMAPSLKGKLIVWFICFSNDLYDNLAPEMSGYRAPFVAQTTDGSWRIETSHINPLKWSVSVGRQGRQKPRILANFFMKSFLGDRAFSACEFLIGKGKEICRVAGAELVIMTIPMPLMLESSPSLCGKRIEADYPDQRILEICHKLNVDVICLKDRLARTDYKPHDEHWNERGHRSVARTIEGLVEKKTALRNQMIGKTANQVLTRYKNPLHYKNENMTVDYP